MADALKCDVAIVGAGPAGSVCALQLARSGLDVCVLERSAFPRTKVCGEYLNLGALAHLRELGLEPELRALARSVEGIRLFGNAAAVELPFPSAAWSIPRSVLDQRLLDAALKAGAKLVPGRVENVRRARDLTLDFRDSSGEPGSVTARVVVGADGADSIVARKCGLTPARRKRAHFALGGHYAGFTGLDRWIEMYVENRSYFALNPLDDATANVMVIVDAKQLLSWRDEIDTKLGETARRLSGGRRTFEGVRIEGKRVAIGPLVPAVHAASAPGVLLAGDAAAFVDPFTGQGLYLALSSAKRAAHAILAHLREQTPQSEAWERYDAAQSRDVADRRRLASTVALLVRTPLLARRAAGRLAAFPDRAQAMIEAVCGLSPASQALHPFRLLRLLV